MPEIAVRIALALLAGTFAWAALAKLIRFRAWRAALQRYELPSPMVPVAAAGVPVAEGAAAGVIVAGAGKPGAALALALLAVFSLAVMRAQTVQGGKLPCGCFGRNKVRDYRVMVVRNALLGAAAAVVLLSGSTVALFEGVRAPERGESLAAALAVLGIALVSWMTFQAAQMIRGGQR
jgi:hypothetical protein